MWFRIQFMEFIIRKSLSFNKELSFLNICILSKLPQALARGAVRHGRQNYRFIVNETLRISIFRCGGIFRVVKSFLGV